MGSRGFIQHTSLPKWGHTRLARAFGWWLSQGRSRTYAELGPRHEGAHRVTGKVLARNTPVKEMGPAGLRLQIPSPHLALCDSLAPKDTPREFSI